MPDLRGSEEQEARLTADREAHALSRDSRRTGSTISLPIVKLMHYRVSLRLSESRETRLNSQKSFKAAIDSIPQGQNNNYKVIIKADRRLEEHRGRYNAPVVDEVAVILVDQECDRRDIVLRSHDDRLHL
ncbi:hypothetical protein EVAR_77896_1 [Eumeta japonica]|uniref:Uncharacterized protein n=1 Tax=Eumeta variegata TaxID=151549 RepID=A0A4C1ZEH6_EUMVA|nr:hypothetical protein EVAR_77896_1 [Eumeta japonica]